MTTPFTDEAQGLLQLLDQNPAFRQEVRRRILPDDLLSLPEQLAELTTNVNAFIEQQVATNARLEALYDSAAVRLTALETNVADLNGSDTERRARENILNIARDELNLTRGRILLARGRDTVPTLLAAITAAEENGITTESQVDDVLLADIIIEDSSSDGRQPVHAVFEVTHTIKLDDIQRAKDRADTVAAATDTDAIAVVIGGTIQPHLLAQAKEMGVRVVIPAFFR